MTTNTITSEIHEQHIENLLRENENLPIKVTEINTLGANQINPSTFQSHLDATILKAQTLTELSLQTQILNNKLISNGLIKDIYQNYDSLGKLPSSDITKSHPLLNIISNINVLPINKFMARTGTNVGNGEGDGYLEFQIRNMFGNGESLKFNIMKGTKIQSSYLLNYSSLLLPNKTPFWNMNIDLFKNVSQLGQNLPLELDMLGGKFSIRSSFITPSRHTPDKRGLWNYEFFMQSVIRSCGNTSLNNTSNSLLFQTGEDWKNSLGSNFVWDSRNNSVLDPNAFPSNGQLFKWFNELNFIGNRSSTANGGPFWKNQLEFTQIRSWLPNDFITMNCTFRTGYIKQLLTKNEVQKGSSSFLHISDKFQNGGPNDIRSFQTMGLGPKDIFNSIGGDAFVSYGISIFSKLPIKDWSKSNFRLHWFLNGGKLINHNGMSINNCFTDLSRQHSISTGVGILLRHPMARFELNFSVPLTIHQGDDVRKGFQFGVGLSFL
ncbi:SAM complex subunit SAM50 NDAI_0G00710 [Naumovozyma dairenensis CBS 421]|uniref:Bacterial surface antigen (D15) domain-containing protein n=1 Tax=Naumovozyma dairenensis (strain ATCC 10597 / BCRC 20456 / CBS 421 / NBRC 0211 / NRRL Y-12639) TaxID=1071378 RepID=G0WDI6_NAUDC|nr:hypothetical protein NDAI_0G00710 [Naumovozyma dairenensis CBS 421]CCD25847.2 hypothetical protein NDAI_0G00710 [Naumovozyma dairenensis CBS 421]